MYCAIELRQLAMGGERPPGEFVVWKDGTLFDASLTLWSQGVDWGMGASELRWRAPAAAAVWWEAEAAHRAASRLQNVLADWGTGVDILDARRGVVEWPRPEPLDWMALTRAVVPALAEGMRGGLAPHPLLARWAARAGRALRLPVWESRDGHPLAVCEARQAETVWNSLPIQVVPASAMDRQRWQRAGFRRVGDVPGLANRLARLPDPRLTVRVTPLMVERRFPDALRTGSLVVLEAMAEELAEKLQAERVTTPMLQLRWEPEDGSPVTREHVWPYAANQKRTIVLRALGLAHPAPAGLPAALTLTTGALQPEMPSQLSFWGRDIQALTAAAHQAAWLHLSPSGREQRLAYWDPWRQGGAHRQVGL